MPRVSTPRSNENLAAFLRRVMTLRESSTEKLAKDLDKLAPKAEKSWLRQVKLWRSGEEGALQRVNAELLGDALKGDFTSFIRRYAENEVASRNVESEVRALREEVAELREMVAPLLPPGRRKLKAPARRIRQVGDV